MRAKSGLRAAISRSRSSVDRRQASIISRENGRSCVPLATRLRIAGGLVKSYFAIISQLTASAAAVISARFGPMIFAAIWFFSGDNSPLWPRYVAMGMLIATTVWMLEGPLGIADVRTRALVLFGLNVVLAFVVFRLLDRGAIVSGSADRRLAAKRALEESPLIGRDGAPVTG